jgi:ABC-2 type transport system ATP-binding protein
MALRQFVLEELSGRDGKTVLLATHNLREAETMAGRIAILVNGLVRKAGTVEEVRRWGVRESRFRLELEPGETPLAGPCRVLSDEVADGLRRVEVGLREGAGLGDLLRALLDAGHRIRACDRVEPDLEEAFTRILRDVEDAS